MKGILFLIFLCLLSAPASAGYVDIAEVKGFLGSRMEIVWNTDDQKWVITFTEKELQGMCTLFLSPAEMKRFRVRYQTAKKKTLALSAGKEQKALEMFKQHTHLHPTEVAFNGRAETDELKWLEIQVTTVHFMIPLKFENRKILDAVDDAFARTQVVPKG